MKSLIDRLIAAKFYLLFSVLFLILTIGIVITIFTFSDIGITDHPQFKSLYNFSELYIYIIGEANYKKWYRAFFYLDFIWAFSLLITVHGLITGWRKNKSKENTVFPYAVNWHFTSLAGMAYLADIIENNFYMGYAFNKGGETALVYLSPIKEILYLITLFYAILKITKRI